MSHINPVPIDTPAIDLTWMVGRVVASVTLLEPLPWRFEFGENERLDVECLWRVLRDGRVLLTNEDHGQLFGLQSPVDSAQEAMKLLAGVPVTSVSIRATTADVAIRFQDGTELEIIPTSSGYESWQLRGPDGICYVATGGGAICSWRVG